MKITPLNDRVMVKRAAEVEVSKGGIIIPQDAQDKPLEGTVVATGPGRLLENGMLHPTGVVEGDRVLFGKYAGTEVEIDDQKYLILRADDIVGVVAKE